MNINKLEVSRNNTQELNEKWAFVVQREADRREIDPCLWELIYTPLGIDQAAVIERIRGYCEDVSPDDIEDAGEDYRMLLEEADKDAEGDISYFNSVCQD